MTKKKKENNEKKMGITRPRPDGGVKKLRKKMGITRPRPDGGVIKKTGITRPRPDGGVIKSCIAAQSKNAFAN